MTECAYVKSLGTYVQDSDKTCRLQPLADPQQGLAYRKGDVNRNVNIARAQVRSKRSSLSYIIQLRKLGSHGELCLLVTQVESLGKILGRPFGTPISREPDIGGKVRF